MSIFHDTWTKALAEIDNLADNQDALAACELATVWKCTYSSARRRIKKLMAAGLATHTQKYYLGSDGRRRPVPAYLLVKKRG
jgi:predicted transcriptional regulator